MRLKSIACKFGGVLVLLFLVISCQSGDSRYGTRILDIEQAVVLDPSSPFALNMTLPNVKVDERILVTIQYSGPGKVVLVGQHQNPDFFYRKMESTEIAGNNYLELKLEIIIPQMMKGKNLRLYVWNPESDPVKVSSFTVQYDKQQTFPEFPPMEAMHLYIDSLDMLVLEKKRNDAFEKGILFTEEDDYVDGILFCRDSVIPVELRLKGDWLDHLKGRKWSFRIKVKGDFTWNRLKTFSIHNPLARDFVNEWVAHELYQEAGLLAPRYGFVPVTLNGKSLGVYAWEEHFDKQLVENQNRREGPIMKFSEDQFWKVQQVLAKENLGLAYPFFEAAKIESFKESRILGDSAMNIQFGLASNLMYQYQYGLAPLPEILDLEKFAAFHALMDLTRGFHGLTWHNKRFYYNPIINRLEPIFFDGYTELGVYGADRAPIAGWIWLDDSPKSFDDLNWIRIYQDEDFLEEFLKKTAFYSSEEWLQSFLDKKKEQIDSFEKLIRTEYIDYRYDWSFLVKNAERIRTTLPAYQKYVTENPDFADFDYKTVKRRPYSTDFHAGVLPSYINAYTLDSDPDSVGVLVQNFIPRTIWIIGSGNNPRRKERNLKEPRRLEAIQDFSPDADTLWLAHSNSYLFCVDDSANQIFSVPVRPVSNPKNYSPSVSLFNAFGMIFPTEVKVLESKIIFPAGHLQISHPLVIPKGFSVEFEAGCELDFIKKSLFLSYSPVSFSGTPDHPVRIYSSDLSARGFTVLQASDTSRINYGIFEGFNTLNLEGWSLTGAVNFYESPVIIYETSFRSNQCEDALNIIRTQFRVENSSFYQTFADAFDSDFCSGLVNRVRFEEIGNDAIDFSGSQVRIENCTIFGAGDKGVSCGENSNLEVIHTEVHNANIGFASKDLSKLFLTNCSGENLQYGLLALQKKPEYGPGYITAKNFKYQSVSVLHLIERASVLNLDGVLIPGQEKNVAKRFY